MRGVIISLDPCVTPGGNIEVIVKVRAEKYARRNDSDDHSNKDELKEISDIRVVFTPGSFSVGEFLIEDAIKRLAAEAVKASMS